MGAYLTTPNTEKVSESGSSDCLKYGAVSMQGWRISQEDAHNCLLNFDGEGSAMFAVYDGHGGNEVAQLAAEELPTFLQSIPAWKEGKITTALQDGFLAFDEALLHEPFCQRLKEIAKCHSSENDEEDDVEEDRERLVEEQSLTMEQLIREYGVTVSVNPPGETVYSERLFGLHQADDVVATAKVEVESKISAENGLPAEKGINDDGALHDQPVVVDGEAPPKRAKVESSPTDETVVRNVDVAGAIETAVDADKDECNGTEDVFDSSDASDDETVEFPNSSTEEENQSSVSASSSDFGEDAFNDDVIRGFTEEGRGLMVLPQSGDTPGVDSGTTACVVLLKDKVVYVANVGDSRCVLCRKGEAIDLSVDHKPEDDLERSRIEKAGGQITSEGRVNGGLNLSRAIGDHFYKTNDAVAFKDQMISSFPDVRMMELSDDDQFLVVACDGIWNSMTSGEVVDFVSKRLAEGKEEHKIAEELCDSCLASSTGGDGTGCDNMTVIIVSFVQSSKNGG